MPATQTAAARFAIAQTFAFDGTTYTIETAADGFSVEVVEGLMGVTYLTADGSDLREQFGHDAAACNAKGWKISRISYVLGLAARKIAGLR